MPEAAVVPTWLVIVVAVATPLLAFAGVLVANVVTRIGDTELEARSRREETMRTLKWAAELAVWPVSRVRRRSSCSSTL